MSHERTINSVEFEQVVDPTSTVISSVIGLIRLEDNELTNESRLVSSIELQRRIDSFLEPSRGALFVARVGIHQMIDGAEEVVAYAAARAVTVGDHRNLDIKHLFVRPMDRRRRVGEGLLSTLIDYASETGFKEVQASVVPHAFAGHRLLRNRGFRRDPNDGIFVHRPS